MKNIIFITLIVVIFASISCKEQINLSANIYGTVKLYDREDTSNTFYQEAIDIENMNDHSGIKVVFIKKNNKNNKFETVTDKNGHFELNNLPSGTYKIIYSKEGYSTFTFYDYQITGGADYRVEIKHNYQYSHLRKKPDIIDCTNVNVEIRNDSIIFTGETEANHSLLYFLISTNSNISDTTFMDWYGISASEDIGGAPRKYPLEYLRNYFIFNEGDIIYWQAYSAGWFGPIIFNNDWSHAITNQYFTDLLPQTNYHRVYGLNNDYNKKGSVIVPSGFKSQFPDGYLPMIEKEEIVNIER
ncbi:MAG: carboxypeptidase regulatory-like domain-containing protein [Bacteroidales bacterium]|nr:carboxypeptidase regulatory-like domain-containing protein [Bacteroidales bacterium]